MKTEVLPPVRRGEIQVSPGVIDGEVLAPGAGVVRVFACPHPFKVARIEFTAEAGLSLAEILVRAQPDPGLRRYAHIFIGDIIIPPDNWRLVRPKPGTTVTIRVVPMDPGGGGKKNPLRTVLTIAVLAAAAAVSGGALGALGLGAAFAAGGTGALIGGTLIGRTGPVAMNWRPEK